MSRTHRLNSKQWHFVSFFLFLATLLTLSSCRSHLSPEQSLEVASKGLHTAAFSSNCQAAVIGSITQGGSYWQLETQERMYNWNHSSDENSTLLALDFSSNDNLALTADPHQMVLWQTQSGESLRFWTAPAKILDAKLSPKGDLALLGLDDHSAVLFNAKQGGILRSLPHDNRVRSVDLSADGLIALTGSEDHSARLWTLKSGKLVHRIKHQDDVQLVKLSPDGRLALSVSKYDKALLWQTDNGKALGELNIGAEKLRRGLRFTAAQFNRDNSLLVTGRPDQMVELWDTSSLKKVAQWKVPKRHAWQPTGAAILALCFDRQNNRIVTAASNGFIHWLPLPEMLH